MKKTLLSLIAFVSVSIALYSQQFSIDVSSGVGGGAGYFPKWDHRAGQLILYRDINAQSAPGVRIVMADGKDVTIYPMRDLPEAQRMTIWDVAEIPDGSVVFSAIAEYGPREVKPIPVKTLLLTYDRTGKLIRFWDVYPYHHHNIAV